MSAKYPPPVTDMTHCIWSLAPAYLTTTDRTLWLCSGLITM